MEKAATSTDQEQHVYTTKRRLKTDEEFDTSTNIPSVDN